MTIFDWLLIATFIYYIAKFALPFLQAFATQVNDAFQKGRNTGILIVQTERKLHKKFEQYRDEYERWMLDRVDVSPPNHFKFQRENNRGAMLAMDIDELQMMLADTGKWTDDWLPLSEATVEFLRLNRL